MYIHTYIYNTFTHIRLMIFPWCSFVFTTKLSPDMYPMYTYAFPPKFVPTYTQGSSRTFTPWYTYGFFPDIYSCMDICLIRWYLYLYTHGLRAHMFILIAHSGLPRTFKREAYIHTYIHVHSHLQLLMHTQDCHEYVSLKNEGDKLIVAEKGELLFVFNLHPTNSYSSYRIGTCWPGEHSWTECASVCLYVCMYERSECVYACVLCMYVCIKSCQSFRMGALHEGTYSSMYVCICQGRRMDTTC